MNIQETIDFLSRQDKESFHKNLDFIEGCFQTISVTELDDKEIYLLIKLIQEKGGLYEDFDDVLLRQIEESNYFILPPEILISSSNNELFDELKRVSFEAGGYVYPSRNIKASGNLDIKLPNYWNDINWLDLTIQEIRLICFIYYCYTQTTTPPYSLEIPVGYALSLSQKINGVMFSPIERVGLVKMFSAISYSYQV